MKTKTRRKICIMLTVMLTAMATPACTTSGAQATKIENVLNITSEISAQIDELVLYIRKNVNAQEGVIIISKLEKIRTSVVQMRQVLAELLMEIRRSGIPIAIQVELSGIISKVLDKYANMDKK